MPEVIDKDVLIRTLRYLDFRNKNLSNAKVPINFRESTFAIANGILEQEGYAENGVINKSGRCFLGDNKYDDLFECRYTPFGYFYKGRNGKMDKKITEILNDRPKPNNKLDQQPLPANLTIMRARYIASEENLSNKSVAFVGDYDSTNIALSLLYKIQESCVFDIDKRLLAYFENIAESNSYSVNVVCCDIFKYRVREYRNKFDIIVTDPPYAMGGIKKFIEFSISLLKEGGIGFLAVPYHENIKWTEQILFEVTKLLIRNDCLITDNKKNFHYYTGADNLKSSMIRFKKIRNDDSADISKLYSYKKRNINRPIIHI